MKKICTSKKRYLNFPGFFLSYPKLCPSSRKERKKQSNPGKNSPKPVSAGYETRQKRMLLLLAEGHTVGALIHRGAGLMGAHQNLVQRAVVLVLAVVCAVPDGTFDTLVGVVVHLKILLFIWFVCSMPDFPQAIRKVAFCKKI